ncbi:MAG TPA: FKBP-type peptidyl-prolyl cis-trans isomerase [Vicinamibacterales bacterium]|nr:FKBP-type peptidyl-prolyl cis-trans isomerase [Vicinamibacterales bacterium]
MRTFMTRALSLAVLILIGGCGGNGTPTTPTGPDQSNVPYSQTDLQVGTGAEAVAGKTIVVAYIGWLYNESGQDHKGTQFDSNAAGTFQIGVGSVIKGWDKGIPGMKVGGIRRLVIPPDLAYGSAGKGPIPPNAALVFDVQLLAVQ